MPGGAEGEAQEGPSARPLAELDPKAHDALVLVASNEPAAAFVLPIVRALDISKHVANNVVLGEAIDAASGSVTEGASLARPLHASGEFPPMVVHMVGVGERSGALEAMLAKVADTYDEEVKVLTDSLTALLEPLLICVLGGAVGFIVIALFLPLVAIIEKLTG